MTLPGTNPRVEAALQSLARDVEPGRDLWPDIEARLEPRAPARSTWGWQVAAAIALVAVSSLVTANLMSHRSPPVARVPATAPAAAAQVTPAAFGPAHALNAEYDAARRQLAGQLQQKLASMPPSARLKLEANLAEMRRAAEEINAALERQPGDALLEELLLNTYQDELGVLASVTQLTGTSAAAPAARQENVKL